MEDYRWDRSSDTISIDIFAHDNGDGTFEYNLSILHYLT